MRKEIRVGKIIQVLFLSLLFGLLLGFSFDASLGLLGVYRYVSDVSLANTVYKTGLTATQLLINDIISFGIAVATIFYLTPKKIKLKKFRYTKIVCSICAASILLSGVLLYFVPKSIISLLLAGVIIISLGEMIAVLLGDSGPLMTLCRTWKIKPFLLFWINCISIGFLYESANWFFPFWVWLPDISHSLYIQFLVIVFGYVVLIHPIVIFWQLMQTFQFVKH